MDIHAVLDRLVAWLTTTGLRIFVILVLALVATSAAKWLSRRLLTVFGKVKLDVAGASGPAIAAIEKAGSAIKVAAKAEKADATA